MDINENENINDYSESQTDETSLNENQEYDEGERLIESEEDLFYEKEVLQDQIEKEEEEELPPPPKEKNEGKQLNVMNIIIFAFIFLIIVILFIIIMGGGKKKTEESEMDKAGSKGTYQFQQPPSVVVVQDGFSFDENGQITTDQSELNQITSAYPDIRDEYAMPNYNGYSNQNKAPSGVAPVGSSGSKAEKPDTRNSRSPRNIEGIKGLDNNQNNNIQKINNALNGYYDTYANPNDPNYKRYDTSQDAKNRAIQNGINQVSNGINTLNGSTKNDFFRNNTNSQSSGEWLPLNSLWDGTIIPAILVTAINTDNPGVVIARVSENVYSSYDHCYLLIPEGTILYGEYNYDVSYGQASVQVGWNLLIRPDGYRQQIGNFPGVNKQGASGYEGSVSNHPWQTLKAMGLIVLFSVLETELNQNTQIKNNTYVENAVTDVYAQTKELENKMLDKALDIKPTITVDEGTEIKIITNTSLQLPPCEVPQATKKYQRR